MSTYDDQEYRPIADYGLIGDTRSAALVARDGSIDWCCWPAFDSPAVFCRLLDAKRGGFFRISPTQGFAAERTYLADTNVLTTTFRNDQGCVRLTDFMPIGDDLSALPPARQIIRQAEGLSGEVELDVRFFPTFDYARATNSELETAGNSALAKHDGQSVSLAGPAALKRNTDGEIAGRLRVIAGQRSHFVLSYASSAITFPEPLDVAEIEGAVQGTIDAWRKWSARCTYEGVYHEWVRRSALALKLLTHSPTGAVLAAPTTSLPEEIGGERNWDYRFTWLRDSALILYALQTIGYHDEAQSYWDWLTRLCIGCGGDLRIVHTLAGGSALPECTLGHLEGYRGSRPVRIGNAAAAQQQLDVYGEVLDAAHFCIKHMGVPRAEFMDVVDHFAAEAARLWRERDHGIWEMRREPQNFLHSKLLCWVALDRAIKLGRDSHSVLARTREEIRATILREGYDARIGAFTQALGSSVLDASALLIPILGFLPAADARVRSTWRCIRERLTSNGLVYRYSGEDGLPGGEASFALCSFWLVDNLALAGEVDEACQLFEQLIGYANDLGLLSEEIEPNSGALRGNFPQGFTHLAVIRSALHIAAAGR